MERAASAAMKEEHHAIAMEGPSLSSLIYILDHQDLAFLILLPRW